MKWRLAYNGFAGFALIAVQRFWKVVNSRGHSFTTKCIITARSAFNCSEAFYYSEAFVYRQLAAVYLSEVVKSGGVEGFGGAIRIGDKIILSFFGNLTYYRDRQSNIDFLKLAYILL